MVAPRIPAVRELVNSLLDRGYNQTVAPVIKAIVRNSTTGLLAQRLTEFEAEAARLITEGQRLTASNPVFRALLADLETTLAANKVLVNGLAIDVQASGIRSAGILARQLALPGVPDAVLAAAGIAWQTPSLDTIAQVVNYTSRPTWIAMLDRYQSGVSDTVQQIAVRGVLSGQNPVAIARNVRLAVEGLPASQANTMLRTLQLTSYRDAEVMNRVANADILDGAIRIATLDDRTCMSCVALHGTRIGIDERVDDHPNGRCVAIPLVKGRARLIESGETWFARQSDTRQRAQMGEAAYRAYKAGEIKLSDFPRQTTDDTFGGQIRAASLKDMLGERAKDFYKEPAA